MKRIFAGVKTVNWIANVALVTIGSYFHYQETSDGGSNAGEQSIMLSVLTTSVIYVALLLLKIPSFLKFLDKQEKLLCVLKAVRRVAKNAAFLIAIYTIGRLAMSPGRLITAPVIIFMLPGAAAIACDNLGWHGLLGKRLKKLALAGGLKVLLVAFEAAVLAFADPGSTLLQPLLINAMNSYNSSDVVKQAWDFVQEQMGCCGTNGPSDWQSVGLYSQPDSCGRNPQGQGCLSMLQQFPQAHGLSMAIIFSVVLFVQISDAIASLIYARKLFKEKREAKKLEKENHDTEERIKDKLREKF